MRLCCREISAPRFSRQSNHRASEARLMGRRCWGRRTMVIQKGGVSCLHERTDSPPHDLWLVKALGRHFWLVARQRFQKATKAQCSTNFEVFGIIGCPHDVLMAARLESKHSARMGQRCCMWRARASCKSTYHHVLFLQLLLFKERDIVRKSMVCQVHNHGVEYRARRDHADLSDNLRLLQ